ncbi:hypothetical protein [Falsibacillus albus]|uniref:Uncharacterized protein n=1 Tax=Falsibacillus albus TaxID=2478915 RepID=A0A3L7JTA4_9BACI|nr:hypothetical protein [Falsibacillus albus]RLQ94073.1 hypothetical protein D9X91_15705 [Falsibacillus albus]
MKKEQAVKICDLIDGWIDSYQESAFDAAKLPFLGETIYDFHQWANGKKTLSAYTISKPGEEAYHLLFIDWHRKDNYYLVIYEGDKSTTAAEIQTVDEDGQSLSWKYNPLKRDGKNAERKAYFKQTFGTTNVDIPLPASAEDVERFISQLFRLCRNRKKADRIVEIFSGK